jgi:hypothetical protein
MARYKPGENKPDVIEGRCAGGCGRKAKPRVFDTCGRQACIQKVNESLRGAGEDNRDPSRGMKVKVDGKGSPKKVTGSKTIKGTHCYVLQDGTAVPINRCTEA